MDRCHFYANSGTNFHWFCPPPWRRCKPRIYHKYLEQLTGEIINNLLLSPLPLSVKKNYLNKRVVFNNGHFLLFSRRNKRHSLCTSVDKQSSGGTWRSLGEIEIAGETLAFGTRFHKFLVLSNFSSSVDNILSPLLRNMENRTLQTIKFYLFYKLAHVFSVTMYNLNNRKLLSDGTDSEFILF